MIFPSITIIFTTAFVFGGFYFIKSLNNNLICQITDVAGEETNPTSSMYDCCVSNSESPGKCVIWRNDGGNLSLVMGET